MPQSLHPTLTTLANGLPVLTVPMDGVESLTAMVLVNTGSRFEDEGKEGIAHFFEHIVFKGTKKFPTAQKLSATIDGLGAEFNAFTSREYTGYYVKAAAKHAQTTLDVLSDMLLAPALRDDDIVRERGVIFEEINMYHDAPSRHVANLFDNLVYHSSGLGHDILGTKKSLSTITSADFKAFLGRWYGLSNMVLVLAGHAKTATDPATLELAQEMFSKDGGERQAGFQAIKPFLSSSGKLARPRLTLEHRTTQQAHFILAWPGIKRSDPDRYTAAVLETILGGNMSSRLFSEVREKRGLCYYVHATGDEHHDKGVMGVSAGVDPARIDEAITVSAGEFHKLADGRKKVTKSELKRAQEYLTGKSILSREDSDFVAQAVGLRKILTGEVVSLDEVLQRIQAVTVDDVHRLAKRLVAAGEARLALIGPFEDRGHFEKLIAKL